MIGCENEGCHCPEAPFERDGRRYCGEYCADEASDLPEIGEEACGCGHDDCGPRL